MSRAAGQGAATLGKLGSFKGSSLQVYDNTEARGIEALKILKAFEAKFFCLFGYHKFILFPPF